MGHFGTETIHSLFDRFSLSKLRFNSQSHEYIGLLLFPDGDLFYDEPGKNPPDHFDVKWACSASRSKRPPCNAVGNWRSSLGGSASSFAPRPKSSHFSLLAVLAFDGSAMSPHFGRNKQKGREQQGTNGAEGTLGTQVNTQFYCC